MINNGKIKPGDHVFCPVESPEQVYAVQRYAGVKQALDAIGATCEEYCGSGGRIVAQGSAGEDYLLAS